MSTSVSLNGVSYTIPATGESQWGSQVSSYLVALSTGVLSKAGGSFTLTSDVDFGANYGLKSIYYKSRGTVSSAGILRLANNESVGWRNALNNADKLLKVNASNVLEFDGNPLLTLALGSADTALVMNSGGTAYQFAKIANANVDSAAAIAYSKLNLSGSIVNADVNSSAAIAYSKLNLATSIVDADVSASAAIAYSKLNLATSIVNADVNASAAIALSKLAAVTASRALVSDGSGFVSAATTTSTQIGYLSSATGTTGTTSTSIVFSTSPTLVTPTLGVASATSINKVAITAPASSATLTIADGKTLTASNTLTFTGTDSTSFAFPSSSSTVMTLASTDSISGAKTFAQAAFLLKDNSSNTVTLQAANSTTSHTLKLPATQGSASTVLTNDGSGNLSWASAASSTLTQYHSDIGDSSNNRIATNTNLLGTTRATTQSATVTITIAAPGVVSYSSHGLSTGDKVYLTTTGALPTGLSASTTYYVVSVDANSFSLASTEANALAGTKITTTGSQSGTHTLFAGGLNGQLASATQRGLVSAAAQSFLGVKTFTNGINLGNTDLANYQETTASVTFNTGTFTGGSAQSVTAVIRRIGKIVTVEFPGVSATANGTSVEMSTSGTPLSSFAPAVNIQFPIVTRLNTGTQNDGYLQINSTGGVVVSFFTTNASNVSSGATSAGYNRCAVTYTMA